MGLIRKLDDSRTEDVMSGTSSHVENLRRPNQLVVIWEVLQCYSKVFPSELPKGVPPARMAHEFTINMEHETPPIHKPLYKLSPLELEEAKKQIQYMLEYGFMRPSEFPYGPPMLFVLKKNGSL